jgi:hypothetical protein
MARRMGGDLTGKRESVRRMTLHWNATDNAQNTQQIHHHHMTG